MHLWYSQQVAEHPEHTMHCCYSKCKQHVYLASMNTTNLFNTVLFLPFTIGAMDIDARSVRRYDGFVRLFSFEAHIVSTRNFLCTGS